MSSGFGVDSDRTKKGWMLSVMSGLLNVNILDRITFGDNSDTTEYGSSSNVVPQYKAN